MNENLKTAAGQKKLPQSVLPQGVIVEVGVAMYEGAVKYARHNYRDSEVLASVFYDATRRHIDSWWEGEDIDPDSHLSHITKAIASLVVLRDAMLHGTFVDDRPPKQPNMRQWRDELQKIMAEVNDRYKGNEKLPPVTEDDRRSRAELQRQRLTDICRRGEPNGC